tara:strand:+ start:971 stop:1153 length:183 start_codon:yes stop_codon:yes gene_type:complete
MSEKEIVSRINTEFNNKVRRRVLWSRTELFELHRNVCDMYLNPIKRKNLAMVRDKYDDVN